MTWSAFINWLAGKFKWISDWFTWDAKQLQQIEATQTEIIGFQLQILNEVQKLGSGNSDAVLQQLSLLMKKVDAMAHTLDDTLAAATAAKTKAESLIALFAGLKAQLDAVLAGALTPAQQEKVDAIFTEAQGAADEIDTALNTNVPPAP